MPSLNFKFQNCSVKVPSVRLKNKMCFPLPAIESRFSGRPAHID